MLVEYSKRDNPDPSVRLAVGSKVSRETLQLGSSVMERQEEAVEDFRLRRFSFASNRVLVKRIFDYEGGLVEGWERLNHSDGHSDFSRLISDGYMVLHHNLSEPVGKITAAMIVQASDGSMESRCTARMSHHFAVTGQLADLDEGFRNRTSTQYSVDAVVRTNETFEGLPIFEVDWTPVEVSLLITPADDTVGSLRKARSSAMSKEADQNKQIMDLATRHQRRDVGQRLVDEKRSLAYAQGVFSQLVQADDDGKIRLGAETNDLQLSSGDANRYSLAKLIRAMVLGGDKAWEDASHEVRVSKAIQQRAEKAGASHELDRECYYIPQHVFKRGLRRQVAMHARTLNTGDDSQLVGDQHVDALYADSPRELPVTESLGVRQVLGLIQNVEIPVMATNSQVTWVAVEGADTAESEPTFVLRTGSPKTLGAHTIITRNMLIQSLPAIEAIVRPDLLSALNQGVDQAVINGSGTGGEPIGVLNTAGIGSIILGTTITWSELLGFKEQFRQSLGPRIGQPAWLYPAQVERHLEGTERFAGSNGVSLKNPDLATIFSWRTEVSQNVPEDLGVGNDEAPLILGVWPEVHRLGWGTPALTQDDRKGSRSGTIDITVLDAVDVIVRRPQAFVVGTGLTPLA